MTLLDVDVTKKELQNIIFVDTLEEYKDLNRTKDEQISDMIWFYVLRDDRKKAEKELAKLSLGYSAEFFPEGLSTIFNPDS